MQYRPLGRSKVMVSEIGFGCMSLGAGDEDSERILLSALDHGINLFDTADIYASGENERLLGKAFQGRRQQVLIASKVGNVPVGNDGKLAWDPSKKHILSSVEGSLRRLQTDYLDLYQLHGGTIDDRIDETIEAFELLRSQGKILHYGISSIRPNVIRTYIDRSSITSVMMQYSLLDRRPEEQCLGLLKQHDVGVIVRGSVAQGLLAGKPARPYLDRPQDKVEAAARAVNVASRDRRHPSQTAILYTLHHPAVSTAVVGLRTPAQLAEVVELHSKPPLSDEEYADLQGSISANYYTDHR